MVKKENDKITASDDKKIQRVEKIKANDRANVVVVGSLALDTIVSFKDKFKLQDSNPGLVRTSIGGVGHNVFFGCHYGLQSPFCGNQKSTRLVSIVGDDYNGNALINQLIGVGIDTLGILKSKSGFTAQYVSNHTSTGELVVACADMSIIEQDFSKHIITQIMRANPELVIIDCNVSSKVLTSILAFLQNKSIRVIIEPTSHVKAGRIGEATLEVFPQNVVDMISPTISELSTIHESFEDNGKFEDYDCWFPLLDLMGIDSQFRQKLDALANRPNFHVLKTILADGTFQKAFQLLPYLPNILIKLGDKGVIMVSLSTSVKSYKSIPTTSSYKPEFLITSQGQNDVGVVIKYFAIPIENKNIDIVNVTGAGDTLLGYLSATLVSCEEANWLDLEIKTIEQEWNLWESIYKSQLASGHVLQNEAATTPFIKNIN